MRLNFRYALIFEIIAIPISHEKIIKDIFFPRLSKAKYYMKTRSDFGAKNCAHGKTPSYFVEFYPVLIQLLIVLFSFSAALICADS